MMQKWKLKMHWYLIMQTFVCFLLVAVSAVVIMNVFDPVASINYQGKTPLQVASDAKNNAAFSLLLDRGAVLSMDKEVPFFYLLFMDFI
jgi:ankyrin repeat protein